MKPSSDARNKKTEEVVRKWTRNALVLKALVEDVMESEVKELLDKGVVRTDNPVRGRFIRLRGTTEELAILDTLLTHNWSPFVTFSSNIVDMANGENGRIYTMVYHCLYRDVEKLAELLRINAGDGPSRAE